MCCCWWEAQDDGEEGVLKEDSLPEFAALLLFERTECGCENRRVSVQTHGVGLTDQYAGERPGVAGMIVVHQEVGYKYHGLNCTHSWLAQIGRHA